VFEAKAARGLCVLLQGQTEFLEKYGEVIGELNARGLTVATFDWRSQGGSARTLADPLKVHVRDFAQYDDDLRSFLDQVVKPVAAGPMIALAHSMGAHNLIRALHGDAKIFSAAVMTAPMLGISPREYPDWFARLLTGAVCALGWSEDYAPGMKGRDHSGASFSEQRVTSDPARHERNRAILRAHPELRVSGPSWGWVDAAYRSIAEVTAPGYAEAIATPTLMFGAGRDRIVHVEADRAFAPRMARARYVEIADREHEILMENDSIRARFWREFDAFTAPFWGPAERDAP